MRLHFDWAFVIEIFLWNRFSDSGTKGWNSSCFNDAFFTNVFFCQVPSPIYYPRARPRQQRRRFVRVARRRALPAARGEADSFRRMTMNRFCTIDRISRCRSFVALENRRGLCPGREKIFAVGDPQYVHLCGKRLWQARRRITLFIPVEY